MRLIDADALIERIKYSSHEYERVRIDTVTGCLLTNSVSPTVDPIHAANACYCKECWYYTEWGECKEFGDIMKPDEFCSRGVPKNGKTY